MARIGFLFILLIFSGCNDPHLERPVIEDLGMIGVMGFDYVDQEQVKVSVTLPQPNQDSQEQVQQFSTTVKLPHEAIIELSTLTEKTLTPAQLRVLLFSEEYARKVGLMKVLENLYRDPQIGTNVYIAIVKGSVEDVLSGTYPDKPEINVYLTELLTPRKMTAFSPFTTIHSFINRKTDEVSDPSTPYIELFDNKSMKITKIALFHEDKLVDFIEPEEAKLIEAMKGKKELPDIVVEVPSEDGIDEEMMAMKFVSTKFNAKVNGDLQKPDIFLYMYVRGSVVDYDGKRKLASEDNRQIMEEYVNEHLEQKAMNSMKRFQELGIDPIGIGDYFRLENARGWSKEKWIESFKRAEITIHVETRIVSTGTIR